MNEEVPGGILKEIVGIKGDTCRTERSRKWNINLKEHTKQQMYEVLRDSRRDLVRTTILVHINLFWYINQHICD